MPCRAAVLHHFYNLLTQLISPSASLMCCRSLLASALPLPLRFEVWQALRRSCWPPPLTLMTVLLMLEILRHVVSPAVEQFHLIKQSSLRLQLQINFAINNMSSGRINSIRATPTTGCSDTHPLLQPAPKSRVWFNVHNSIPSPSPKTLRLLRSLGKLLFFASKRSLPSAARRCRHRLRHHRQPQPQPQHQTHCKRCQLPAALLTLLLP